MGDEGRSRRVLVVDDEPRVARAHARVLKAVCEVRWCTSYDEALEVLETDRFDLLLSDLQLGGKSGLDLCARVAARWPEMRRCLCTGLDMSRVARLPTVGVVERILEKPIAVAVLRAAVLDLVP